MALTKADMAESLYEELGLNKREAKELVELFFEEARSALGDAYHVKQSARGETLKLGKKFRFLHAVSLPSDQGRN